MPRDINGYDHYAHYTNMYEFYKAKKLTLGVYGEDQVKIIENSYYGNWYADIYVKEDAEQKRKLTAMFGSAMTFEDNDTGEKSGDRIRIKET